VGAGSYIYEFVNDIYQISIRGLFGLFPYVITFGILLFNFGRINQEEYGKYIKTSGILATVGYGVTIISVSLIYVPIGILSNLLLPLSYGGSVLILFCYIFITVHGIKNRDRNLKIFGSLYLIGFLVSIIASFILFTLFPIELT
jgi:hypothetical protein